MPVQLEAGLVELPLPRRSRLTAQYGISADQAEFICSENSTADFFEETAVLGGDPETIAKWMGGDIQKQLNRTSLSLIESPLTPERLASLLSLLKKGGIHGKIAKQVLKAVFDEDKDPETIIRDRGLTGISDRGELLDIIREVLQEHQSAMEALSNGEEKVLGFLIGQIMKKTSGRADPEQAQELLKETIYANTHS
jgi:aspartyl-tRNA(Asn)/glutamyl-tRNA(Gln) amidotransferase subunit B